MASVSSTSSTPTCQKSKQERIRDNQRRSRARRQEYLSDLERRLKECHITCREAELQRTALADLQLENTRLRDLLKYAGLSSDLIEGYGRHNMGLHTGQILAAQPRQIRPKYQPSVSAEHCSVMITKRTASPEMCPSSGSPGLPPNGATSGLPMSSDSIYGSHQTVSFMTGASTDSMSMSTASNATQMSPYHWMSSTDGRSSVESSFCCDTFGLPPNGPLLPDNGETIPCSVAKMMIDQYHPTTAVMEDVKLRLATGFSLPRASEPGCRVNTQLVYQVLQDLDPSHLNG